VLLMPVLWYEHRVIKPDDLSRAEIASFVANGVFSVVLFIFAASDVVLLSRAVRI
jgi:4-hydroxybenzoate polyprenyltransferase